MIEGLIGFGIGVVLALFVGFWSGANWGITLEQRNARRSGRTVFRPVLDAANDITAGCRCAKCARLKASIAAFEEP
jgi:hypothetical protein